MLSYMKSFRLGATPIHREQLVVSYWASVLYINLLHPDEQRWLH